MGGTQDLLGPSSVICMCDLLGMCFAGPVTASISLDVFQTHGSPQENPDGWGVAYYNDNLLQVIKEPHPASDSQLYNFAEQHIRSEIIISHVRKTSVGEINYFNTHPFCRQIRIDGTRQEWTLAHNGTLGKLDALTIDKFQPLGDTDSERLFCHLLDFIVTNKISTWRPSDYELLNDELLRINRDHGTLNCLFSDGTRLFCYSDKDGYNCGLRYVHRKPPFGTIDLIRRDQNRGVVTIRTVDLAAIKNESGFLIVTEELTNENWVKFNAGELRVFSHGEQWFP